uniref:DUF3752 domain-containing protein n=1 Tax=Pectinophora gossypiella TaxID=13191 RepID=A0A1E1W792_PECGO
MLSDESSSDSETGRFKGRSKKEDDQTKTSQKEENFRLLGRSRPENDRFRRGIDKSREERDRYDRRSREQHRYSRHSPVRRRHSRDRSPYRRSRERERPRHRGDSPRRSRPRDYRSSSRDRRRHSRSRSHKSPEPRRDFKAEIKRNIKDEIAPSSKEKTTEDPAKKSRERSLSLENKGKRSEIHKPTTANKRKSSSPIVIEERESDSEEVQPGSYYSMIPAVIKDKREDSPKEVFKEKSDESSEIDSSDDEKLRAKLLNLEKELHKTKKKKHKRKHKKKSSKSSKERDREPTTVEVTSTTDIDKADVSGSQTETAEVTSTQKANQKESSEEGEISSDDDSQQRIEIDPTDLRHKLKRSKVGTNSERKSPSGGICGPALPPHLQKRYERSKSPDIEGPALPPHLKDKPSKSIGPSIPENMRKVLAEQDPDEVKYVSSDEDTGIGPLPTGLEDKWSDAHKRLEERALDMKIKKLDGHSLQSTDAKSREQWMLELPEAKAKYLGLEARSFRAKEGPDMSDRSSWTDTPEEKNRKAAGIQKEEDPEVTLQREAKARHIANRDDEQEKAVKKHKKKHKREESLLEMHQKKLKKKKKKDEKEDGKSERRPFSREVDLQVNRFDEAQKKSIIKKAQELNTRFGRGEAKFL